MQLESTRSGWSTASLQETTVLHKLYRSQQQEVQVSLWISA